MREETSVFKAIDSNDDDNNDDNDDDKPGLLLYYNIEQVYTVLNFHRET